MKSPLFFEQLILDLLEEMGYAYNKESIITTSRFSSEAIDYASKQLQVKIILNQSN